MADSDSDSKANEALKLQSALNSARLQIKGLNEQLDEKNQQIGRLQTLAASDAAKRLEQENSELTNQIDDLNKKNQIFQQRVHDLEQELADSGTHQQSLRLRELRSLIDEYKKRSRQSALEIAHWKKLAMIKESSI